MDLIDLRAKHTLTYMECDREIDVCSLTLATRWLAPAAAEMTNQRTEHPTSYLLRCIASTRTHDRIPSSVTCQLPPQHLVSYFLKPSLILRLFIISTKLSSPDRYATTFPTINSPHPHPHPSTRATGARYLPSLSGQCFGGQTQCLSGGSIRIRLSPAGDVQSLSVA